MKEKYILEQNPSCYISIDHNIVDIHLDFDGFITFVQAFWIYRPFPKERKRGLQYFSHLIMDCEAVIIDGEERYSRCCPDVDFFILKGKVK